MGVWRVFTNAWRLSPAEPADWAVRLRDRAAAAPAGPTLASEVAYLSGVDASGRIVANSYWSGYERISAFKFGAPTAQTGATATYAFDVVSNFTAVEKATFVRALAVWQSVADIRFSAASDPAGANILLHRGHDQSAYTSGLTSTGSGATLGQHLEQTLISIDTSVAGFDLSGSLDRVGGYGFATAVHEIGHAIGLGHGGAYNLTANPATQQFSIYDTALFTTMSYFSWADGGLKYGTSPEGKPVDWGTGTDGYQRTSAHTAMQADIAAVQALYGAAKQTPFATAQTFGFHTTVTGPLAAIFDFAQNRLPVVTLYSSALGNTLDLSGFAGVSVSLVPGSISDVGGLYGNLVIAAGTWIDRYVGSAGYDAVTGNDHANAIDGGDGDDELQGGAGDDVLIGGRGDDRLFGGAGNDTFFLIGGTASEEVGEGIDHAYSSGGNVTLSGEVETLAFTTSAAGFGQAGDTSTTMFGNVGNDELDGGSFADTLFGGVGDDRLAGGSGGDRLTGAAGDDWLAGGGRDGVVDTLAGGPGSDTYYDVEARDGVVERARDPGVDLVVTFETRYTLPTGVEDLEYYAYEAGTLTGSDLNNSITGFNYADALRGLAGDDLLRGGDGTDTLDGGLGADRMEGGNGDDRYLVDDSGDIVVEQAGGGHDIVLASIAMVLADQVEDLVLTGAARRGTGNALANTITGGKGADTLAGLDGDDWLAGGKGIDLLTGGAGADRFVFAAGDTGAGVRKADTIADLHHFDHDVIDLSAFAADTALQFIARRDFSGVGGEVRFAVVNGATFVTADFDGDRIADLTLRLTGDLTLVRADFALGG